MRLLLFGLLVSLPALAQAQQLTLRDLMADSVRVGRANCALFPAAAELDTLELHVAASAPYRFTPTRQQVDEVEKQLAEKGLAAIAKPTVAADSMRAFIQQYAPLAYIQAHLPAYRRQYYGFYNSRHQPCLRINLAEHADSGWLYRYISVEDGGAEFWRVSYNLVTRRFYGFDVNGQG